MTKQIFEVELLPPPGAESSAFYWVPFRVEEVFGSKAMVKVRGTVDGVPFRNVIMPNGKGQHYTVVNREIREAIGKKAGDRVRVEMEVDTEERVVEVPEDFQQALSANEQAATHFARFSYSQRKEYVRWIEVAKKPETRERRIQKAVEKIAEGRKYQ
jgi:hypothetical protein